MEPTFLVHGPTSGFSGNFIACRRCNASTSLSIADSPSSGYAECAIFPRAVSSTCKAPFVALAIDHEPGADRALIGGFGADRISLLAYEEEHANVNPVTAQLLSRYDLRGDDPLGIARSSSVNRSVVFG